MKIFGFAGWSGSGKTTLVTQVIPALSSRGLKVSTIKHTHHKFDIDKPGKDTYRHREAGAHEVFIAGGQRWALLHENRGEREPTIEEMLERMTEVDLVLIEGFKTYPHPKMEIFRSDVGKPMLCADDPTIVAIATTDDLDVDIPRIDLNDIEAVADFIIEFCELPAERRHGAA